MDAFSVHKLVKGPIYSHCVSADGKWMVVSDGECGVVYRMDTPDRVVEVGRLRGHDKVVTAVDISKDGRIVTCSQDRNAVVWERDHNNDGEYKASMVLLRINRAATCVRWAHSGRKFAVGSSARVIAVCYYEEDNDWWVSKHIKKPIQSSITCVSWHDNDVLLACGGVDGHVRVFSGFIKGLDNKEQVEGSPWGDRFPFGSIVRDWHHGAWIQDVAWNGATELLGFVGHDGCVGIFGSTSETPVKAFGPDGLPFRSMVWVDSDHILCGGYSCHPVVFKGASKGQLTFDRNIGGASATNSAPLGIRNGNKDDPDADADDEEQSFGISALKKFKELDLKGKISSANISGKCVHDNAITELRLISSSAVSSSGLDGKVVIFAL